MRRTKRKPEGFNIAFLDVMSCGLGAVTLIFMLVKYQTEVVDTESSALVQELAVIESQTESTLTQNRLLESQLQTLTKELQQKESSVTRQIAQRDSKMQEIEQINSEIAKLTLEIQKNQIASADTSAVNPSPQNTEDHLIGLKVSGRRILILLDSSASMADERLVDIVQIQVSDTATKMSAPKWQRTLRVVNWILDRVPENSEYMIVTYSQKANFLHGNQWVSGSDLQGRQKVTTALRKLYPDNATNLYAALKHVKDNRLRPSDIYIVTDGLPTKGSGKLIRSIRLAVQCKSFSSKTTTISSSCREALFYSAIRGFSTGRNSKINTVLLPIEGDPDAAFAYWQWSSSTGGMMVSPPSSWP